MDVLSWLVKALIVSPDMTLNTTKTTMTMPISQYTSVLRNIYIYTISISQYWMLDVFAVAPVWLYVMCCVCISWMTDGRCELYLSPTNISCYWYEDMNNIEKCTLTLTYSAFNVPFWWRRTLPAEYTLILVVLVILFRLSVHRISPHFIENIPVAQMTIHSIEYFVFNLVCGQAHSSHIIA